MSKDEYLGQASCGAPLDNTRSPLAIAVPVTAAAPQNSAVGSFYGSPGRGSAASEFLRSLKHDVENEEEGSKKKRGKGGGRKDKINRLGETNRHLMKKGIVDLEPHLNTQFEVSNSGTAGNTSTSLPFVSSTGNLFVSPTPVLQHESANTCMPGVLVAGAGGNIGVLEGEYSTENMGYFLGPDSGDRVLSWTEGQSRLAEGQTSPDSEYGSTPDSGNSDRSDSATNVVSKPSQGETATLDVTHEKLISEHSASLYKEDKFLKQVAKFSTAVQVESDLQPLLSPSTAIDIGPGTTLTADHLIGTETTRLASQLCLPNSASTHSDHLPPRSPQLPLCNDPLLYHDPSSQTFSPSPGSSSEEDTCHIPGCNTNNVNSLPYNFNAIRTISSLPRLNQLDATSKDGVGHKKSQPIRGSHTTIKTLNDERFKKLRNHRTRSLSQPMTVNSDFVPNVSSDHKDYFQVSDELSKENSHFALSEALLAVIEQYKANCVEEMHQMIRGGREDSGEEELEEPDASLQISSMFHPRFLGSDSFESVEGFSARHVPKICLLEVMQSASDDNSAESTAQKLLQFIASQFSEVDMDDMNVTQTVLTLPADFLTSLSKDEDLQKSVTTSTTPLRGNKEWAPPRAQIIFHVKHPSRNILQQLAAQGYRCTGCGMKQEPSQARQFRFCNYTGKYFCQKCHTNAASVVPAYIMHSWSFKKYYVSNFARDLLARIYNEPVFDLQIVNPQIYSRVPILAQARDIRTQLIAVKKYLKTCRRAQSLNATFEGYLPWTADVHTYSILDFVQIRLKLRYLKSLLSDSIKHVNSCPLCQGKGFVCEFCSNSEIIYPFQLNKVTTCEYCQCCFHNDCFRNKACPRCIRIRQRERRRRMQLAEDNQSSIEHPT